MGAARLVPSGAVGPSLRRAPHRHARRKDFSEGPSFPLSWAARPASGDRRPMPRPLRGFMASSMSTGRRALLRLLHPDTEELIRISIVILCG